MSKKKFIDTNPVNQYLDQSPIVEAPREEEPTPTYVQRRREPRSRRVNLLMQPSLYAAIEEAAERQGTSVNSLIHEIMDNYINEVKR